MYETTEDHGARIEFRASDAIAKRVRALAAYSGNTLSEWLRLAVALTDTEVVLTELDRLEQLGDLGPERQQTRAEALATRDAIREALGPAVLDVAGRHLN